MDSNVLSRRDIDFLLFEWLEVESLLSRQRFSEHSRETIDAALELYRQIAVERFLPHNKKSDQQEPHWNGSRVCIIPEVALALEAFSAAGLMAAAQDYDIGGMQLPAVVERAGFAWLIAANPTTSGYPFLTIANVNLIQAHGSPEQVSAFVRPMMAGRFFGTMCLSEPQAGSSLADIATRAEIDVDGLYRLFGNKMWISGGEHELAENIVHLVLARIAGSPPGVKGISLFIVPKFLVNPDGSIGERNDVVLAGLNHKMGYRGTVNTALNFGEGKYCPGGRTGAIGYLVGEPNHGLSYMFQMMNESRIGVGLGAAALGYTGYLHALDYARNRRQGRLPQNKDPTSPPVAIIQHADVKRMLLAQKTYAEGGLALVLYCARLVDEERTADDAGARHRASLLLDVLTPIAKSWPSQWCLAANDLAIQVHGGYGYTRDYNVEQFYRDNRLNAIHEGTHGIQALDLLGRKVTMEGGAAFAAVLEKMQDAMRTASQSQDPDAGLFGCDLGKALEQLTSITHKLAAPEARKRALANASLYLEAFGHVIVAWIWLEQLLTAARRDPGFTDDFYRGKKQACRYFFRFELPRIGPLLNVLEKLDTTTLEMQEAWF